MLWLELPPDDVCSIGVGGCLRNGRLNQDVSDSRLGGRSSGDEPSALGVVAEIGDGWGEAARDVRKFDGNEPRRRLGTGAASRVASHAAQSCAYM